MADPREPAGQERLSILYSSRTRSARPASAGPRGTRSTSSSGPGIASSRRVERRAPDRGARVAHDDPRRRRPATTPPTLGRRRPAYAWHDRVTARAVQRREVDVVHAWPLAARRTFAAAAARGIPAVREVPNTHTAHAYDIVAEELSLLGLKLPPGASHAFNAARLREEEREWSSATAISRRRMPSLELPRSRIRPGPTPAAPVRLPSNDRRVAPGPRFAPIHRGLPRPGRAAQGTALRAAGLAAVREQHGRFLVYGVHPGIPRIARDDARASERRAAGFTDDAMGALGSADVLMLPTIEEGSALVT